MTEFQTITCETRDGVTTIALARPEKRNAMNAQMFKELGDAAQASAEDALVRAVLVSGQGPSFCAGIDLSALSGLAGEHGAEFQEFVHMAQRPFRALATMEKPTVAAVQGHALGAGFQLALACDLRIAAPDVKFGMLEGRYGLIPDLGGAHHLARLIGASRAKELVWSTRLVEADEAERLGLVNRVTGGDLLTDAERWIGELLAVSTIPLGLTKSLIDRAHETPLEEEFEREGHAQAQAIASEDHREAIAAFLEKRPPRFTGQ